MTKNNELPANNIRLFRNAIGLTQNDLALKTQIPAPTLRRYERGEGKIPAPSKEAIAKALDQSLESVFPSQAIVNKVNRRGFLANSAMTGAGLSLMGLSPFTLNNPTFQGNRQNLSKDEIQILAEDNYSLWELLNALQKGASIQFVSSVAQGKLIVLKHMADCSLLPNQKVTMLNLLADAYLLLGRICEEIQDFGSGEAYFSEALKIAHETKNVDLITAARQRYGYMLIDQERFRNALKNADAGLIEGTDAAFPIKGEIQLYAAQCYAYNGDINKARAMNAKAKEMERGRDPEIWFGKLLNPRTSYTNSEIIINLIAGKNYEAIQASEQAIKDLNKEEPDNLTWRANLQERHARALWQFGSIDEAAAKAKESLENSRTVGSIVNETRIEKLYQSMIHSQFGKRHSIQELGAAIGAN